MSKTLRTACSFDKLSMEKRAEIISKWDAKTLLKNYDICRDQYNPLDDDVADTYVLIRAEIIKRCAKEE